jgi:polyisoprenoid-binding protein YceI
MKLLSTAVALLAPLAAADYKIDAAHSSAQFTVKHMMVSNVKGEFTKLSGTVSYDENKPEATAAQATIDVTTVNTREPRRDDHLRSADFFDAAKFPTMTFQSKKAAKTASGLALTGDLTMHGVTKEIVLQVEGITPEVKHPSGSFVRGASASTRISRKDFGLLWNRALEAGGVVVSDEVLITIDLEIVRPGAAPAK